MFIRKTKKLAPDTKKAYFNFQLVESIRTPRGPRQRILLNLGTDLDLDPYECKLLADRIEMLVTGQVDLLVPFPEKIENLATYHADKLVQKRAAPVKEAAPLADAPDYHRIDLSTFTQSTARTVGAEHILLTILRELRLPEYLKQIGFSPSSIALSLGTIIARAVFPASERASFSWLRNQSGLGELIDFDFHSIGIGKFYEISDSLFKHQEDLEKYLEKTQRTRHGIKSSMILYDLTNTYMEGQAKGNPKAKHGHSKEKRTDCPLVTLGLVVDAHGFPLRSKFLPGNVSEPKSLEEAILALGYAEDLFKPTLILDAGIASDDNLKWLRKNQYPYIVCARQNPPTTELLDDYHCVGSKEQVKVAHLKVEGEEECWLICHSEEKAATASQMKARFQQRFEEALSALQTNICKAKKKKEYATILQRVGRLQEKHKRISGCYEVTVVSADGIVVTDLEWKINPDKLTEKLTGEYFLRTNLKDKSAAKLWELYNMLRHIEGAFRFMKSTLGMRPIYHQKERRVDGHLWITVLAYYLIQDIVYRLREKGIADEWQTIRTHMNSRIRVSATAQTDANKTLHVRSTTEPEQYHRTIYKALGISARVLAVKKAII